MENISLKKIIAIVIILTLAVFLFKYIGIILVALTAGIALIFKYVLKAIVVLGAIALIYYVIKKS